MKKMSEPIVFFGSGPVAAASLESLAQHFTIEAVVTKPKPAHHKGDVPVIRVAEGLGLQIQTADSKHSLDTLFTNWSLQSRVAVLVDFGIIVSREVINYFPLGIVNSHFSLLPEWRGADPITFAILSGQKQTGVSLMLLVEAMDEGPVIAQGLYDIAPGETTATLTDGLIDLSNVLLQTMLPAYVSGKAVARPQDQMASLVKTKKMSPTYSRKLSKDDGILNWNKPAVQLEREIRAFAQWPKSRTSVGSLEVVITKAHVVSASGKPGAKDIIDKLPTIYCAENALAIDKIKPAGKQEMTGEAFLAGYKKHFLTAD